MKLPPAMVEGERSLINVVIETPKGSRNKFAFEEESYLFLLKKILPAGTAFPLDFGFIPHTLAADGDPLDALVVMEQSTYPGCLIRCRPIGIIKGEQKHKGQKHAERNDRVIAVPEASVDYARLKSIKDLSEEHLADLTHFFMYYNAMEGGSYKLLSTEGPREALAAIKESIL
jgi:inorganic pyrophosphatase